MMMTLGAVLTAIVVLLLCLVRLFLGPTLYDRVAAANAAALCVALAMAGVGVARNEGGALDAGVALVLALLVANVAMFKFSYAKTFQTAIAEKGG